MERITSIEELQESIIYRGTREEYQGLLSVRVRVYKRRWWILFLFASLGFMQCAIWNTWAPITSSVKAAYPSWDDAEIGLLSMWGTITMIIGLFPFTIMLQKKGLRVSMIVTSGLVAAASAVRLFATQELQFTALAHIGAILNGFAGIIIGCAPSLLSSTWFPPNQRTTATGIGCTFNQLGNAGGFFLGPWIVKDPRNGNGSGDGLERTFMDINTEIIRHSIRDYMWITAALCVPLFLFVLAYFPDKPKRPPSLTSAFQDTTNDLTQDFNMLKKNGNFWLLMIPYSLTIGINVAWSSVLDINLAPIGISQAEASMIGVYMTVGGVGLAILSSRFTDILFGHIKLTLIVLLILSTLMFTWFLFIMNGCLPFDKTSVFISSIAGASLSYACSPLFFELAVELSFPVSEGVVGSFLTLFWNLTAALFLGLLQLKLKSVLWMDYLLSAQGMVSIVALLFVKEEYRRSALDHAPNSTVTVNEQGLAADEEDRTTQERTLFGEMFKSTGSYGAVDT